MNPIRSMLAVLGGLGAILFTTQALELVLVRATAGDTVQDLESFLAAANTPAMLAAKLVYSGLMAILGGYLVAKVAPVSPVAHGVFAAGVLAVANISGFTTDEMAAAVPVAARVALVAVMSGAMLVGAIIRAKAVALGTGAGPGPAAEREQEETRS